jgi:hypothetical protein
MAADEPPPDTLASGEAVAESALPASLPLEQAIEAILFDWPS